MREIDLTKQSIEPFGDIEVYDGLLDFAWELWFDVDAYFGTNTKDDDNMWINFYTDYNPQTDDITACYTIDSPNDVVTEDWELTRDEKLFIRSKMEQYCKKTMGNIEWENCENVLLTAFNELS